MPPSQKRSSRNFLHNIARTIRDYHMFERGQSVLVGVSGGPDSVALLHALRRLAPLFSLDLTVAHLNHGLRQAASDADAEFVAELARRLDLKCVVREMDVHAYRRRHKLSLEEAARMLRYDFFRQAAAENGLDRIALGHHQDDTAELVCLYLFRGSGPLGLAGIPPVRGNIVRPLIQRTRREIFAFLAAENLDSVRDASNQDPRFLRNRVRLQLIPDLQKAYNPSIVQTLARSAQILRDENEWIEATLEPVYRQSFAAADEGRLTLRVPEVRKFHPAVVRRIVRRALREVKGDLRRITFRHIAAVVQLFAAGPPDGRLYLPDGIRAQRSADLLYLYRDLRRRPRPDAGPDRAASHEPGGYAYRIERPSSVFVKEYGRHIRFTQSDPSQTPDFAAGGQETVFLDLDKLTFPLTLRNFRPGDRFTPLGMHGSQKVKNFFINSKIPRAERANCPLLISAGNIVWIVGHRIADSVKIDPTTRRCLKGEVLLA